MSSLQVSAYTVLVKTNLESPTGPKLKRKFSAEPTMTLHTKAANNDILDIFNQPLSNVSLLSSQIESAGESDYDDDDDYTSAGESNGTERISGPSEFGDDETDARITINHEETDVAIGSPWSDFTASKHVPKLDLNDIAVGGGDVKLEEPGFVLVRNCMFAAQRKNKDVVDNITPVLPHPGNGSPRTKYIPLPPKDCEVPNRPFRDPSQAAQNRLPFMTPIVEKTESSMGAMTILEQKEYFNSKTPSRWNGDGLMIPETDDRLMGTPFQEIFNEARATHPKKSQAKSNANDKASLYDQKASAKDPKGPPIKDTQCNPVDESIRKTIIDNLQPTLSSYHGFFDHRPLTYNKGPEIRKYVKAVAKASKGSTDKTTTNLALPPTLDFPHVFSSTYTIKRELGKGAFAPVYLIQQEEGPEQQAQSQQQQQRNPLLALKCEHPPTCWEFYIMTTLHSRLSASSSHYSTQHSLLKPYALHLFADEGYLLEQYLEQGTLLNLVNLAKSDPQGVLDEAIAMFFTVELLRTVESMHAAGILHGDLKADNCLVRLPLSSSSTEWDSEFQASGGGGWAQKGLCLIDFGRGIDLRQFIPEVQFVADWKTGKSDCAEMREMRPWTWQVDYWGIAGVAHNLLFGKYIEDVAVDIHSTVAMASVSDPASTKEDIDTALGSVEMGLGARTKKWKLKEPLKRYWQTELWADLFDALLNPAAYVSGEEGSKMPIARKLRACREGMEGWLEREGGRKGLKSGLRRLEERIREQKGR